MTDRHSTPAFVAIAAPTPDPLVDAEPHLVNLDGDVVEAPPNETILLDFGQNADVVDLDGDLAYLAIYTWDQANTDVLGFQTTEENGIELLGLEIHIDGNHIGTIFEESHGTSVSIDFTDAATPELVQRLIRALTFTTSSTDAGARKRVTILLGDQHPDHFPAEANVDVVIATPGVHVLTPGADSLFGADRGALFVTRYQDLTAGDEISGGDGHDILRLDDGFEVFDLTRIVIGGIERIQGSHHFDQIALSADQLVDVTQIDGGLGGDDYDILYLSGTDLDLTGKTVTNFRDLRLRSDNARLTTDNVDLARKVFGILTQNDELILTSGTLDDGARLILHRQGIDKITDETGRTTTHTGPQVANVGGDRVVSDGNNPVLLDAGSDATVTDDDGQLRKLKAYVTTRTSSNDILGIAETNGIEVGGLGNIRVDGVSVGSIDSASGASVLTINISINATEAQVEKLVRALTYRHAAGGLDQDLQIKIDLTDIGGRTSSHTVTVEAPDDPGPPTRAPVINDLHGDQVISAGTDWVYLDNAVPALATVTDDGHLTELQLIVANAAEAEKSVFKITEFPENVDGYELVLTEGMSLNSEVQVKLAGGVLTTIGTIASAGAGAGGLIVALNSLATPERVKLLLQHLSYKRTDEAAHAPVAVQVKLTDDDNLTAAATVTVTAPDTAENAAPTDVRLAGQTTVSVTENSAFSAPLSASDADNDPLTFSFDAGAAGGGNAGDMFVIDNAIGQLKLAPGKTLDFETARSFTVYVKASDGRGGVSATQSLTINVTDVADTGGEGGGGGTPAPVDLVLTGTSKANRLTGQDGNDRLYGKAGKDVLTGGAGKLDKKFFKIADKAKDGNDYLVYDRKKGVLSYDADGSGAGKAVEIAKLSKNLRLTEKDFFVV